MQGRILTIGACALAIGILGACGDDDDSGGGSDEAENPITGATPEESADDQAALEQELLDLSEEYAPQLEALEPPDELAEDWDEYLALADQQRELAAESVEVLEAEDLEGAARVS